MKNKIAIIGLGFMGISFARSLKSLNENYLIYAFNRNERVSSFLKGHNIIDNYYSNYSDLVKNSDIIILSTPISSFSLIINSIKDFLTNQIIVDFGSIKEKAYYDIINILKSRKNLYIPCHPIAGGKSINSNDIENDFNRIPINLYKNKTINLFPTISDTKNYNIIKNIFHKLKSNIDESLTIKEHDKIYALTSHLPIFISFIYIQSVSKKKDIAYNYFLKKFSDKMWIPIFIENINNIEMWLKKMNNFFVSNKVSPKQLSSIILNIVNKNHYSNYIGKGFKKFILYKSATKFVNFNTFIENQNRIIDICKNRNDKLLTEMLLTLYNDLLR